MTGDAECIDRAMLSRAIRAHVGRDVLDDVPDEGPCRARCACRCRWCGVSAETTLAVPELSGRRDREILARVLAAASRRSAGDEGWRARFGRELNATDDRAAFRRRRAAGARRQAARAVRAHAEPRAQFIDRRRPRARCSAARAASIGRASATAKSPRRPTG